ncbi:hypothetical protein [Cryobacterium sp. PAMC25264]|uniref:hypothetical protein n=1 Tax=Cryobacterium sp. PAMC25264 TaxID=2861288 RepID=UPI001C624D4D|nr:hypothetical protein [Cryobacterium sp. PAMC25264]QYF73519.1 hypothetical protein KY500_17740 [Cryobacterium sp. PAMC25264]
MSDQARENRGALAVVSIGTAVILRHGVLTLAGNQLAVALNWTLMGLISTASTVLARSVLVPVAGLQLISPVPGLGLLDPVAGALVTAAWATVLLGAALTVFNHRDL